MNPALTPYVFGPALPEIILAGGVLILVLVGAIRGERSTEAVTGGPDRSRTTVQSLRKSRTFYYNPLTADGFDRVIEPVILEPVVQFTLYLKLKYEIETRR